MTRCPCRKKSEPIAYETCCGRFHRGQVPETAEALMRSRYTAYATHNARYLLETWHPTTRPAAIDVDDGLEWYMLKIVGHTEIGTTATVTFSARSRLKGSTHDLRETSRFVRENGRWYYVEGMFADA